MHTLCQHYYWMFFRKPSEVLGKDPMVYLSGPKEVLIRTDSFSSIAECFLSFLGYPHI